MKTKCTSSSREEGVQFAHSVCTAFAAKHISEQIQLSTKCVVEESEGSYKVTSEGGQSHECEVGSCTCSSVVNFNLPCRHMIAIRRHLNLRILETDMIPARWTKQYFNDIQNINLPDHSVVGTQPCQQSKVKPGWVKFNEAQTVCKDICSFLVNSGADDFRKKLQLLCQVRDLVKTGKDFVVVEVFAENLGESVDEVRQQGAQNHGETDKVEAFAEQDTECGALNHGESDEGRFDQVTNDRNVEVTADVHAEFQRDHESLEVEVEERESNVGIMDQLSSLKDTILPPLKAMKKGRPAGSLQTVIGLPKAKKRKRQKEKLKCAKKVKVVTHAEYALRLIVDENLVNSVMKENLKVEEEMLEMVPEKVSMEILGIDDNLLKQWLTDDAWVALQQLLEVKRSSNMEPAEDVCRICWREDPDKHLDRNPIVQWNECLRKCNTWYHEACIHATSHPQICFTCHTSI